MIEDVKTYFNTVGSRLTKAFETHRFDQEKETVFWQKAAQLASQKSIPQFQEIALWLDQAFRARVHFVYRRKGDKLELFRRHIVTANLHKSDSPTEDLITTKQERSNIENRLVNLDAKIKFEESFKFIDVGSFAIGQCQYIPLFKDEQFWGIYSAGPYVQIPDRLLPRISTISTILSNWLVEKHLEEKEIRYNLSARVRQNIKHETERNFHFENIAYYLLIYAANITDAKSALLISETDTFSIIQSVHFPHDLMDEKYQSAEDDSMDFQTFYVQHKDDFRDYNFSDIKKVSLKTREKQLWLYLLFSKPAEELSLESDSFRLVTDSLDQLIEFKSKHNSYVRQLLQTYYQMLRAREKKNAATASHTPRIVAFSSKFAKAFGLSEKERKLLLQASQLHDIGYLATDFKTVGTEVEHPSLGKMMLEGLSLPQEITMGVAAHHEWVDGSGTPLGLSGADIPWTAKIICIFEFVVEFIEKHKDDKLKKGPEWVKTLTDQLLSRAGKEFDMLLIPTAFELIQTLGWKKCCHTGTEDDTSHL